MLELIFALIAWAAALEPRSFTTARASGGHDSQILIAPDSMFDQGRPAGFGDYRGSLEGDLRLWALTSDRHRVGVAGDLLMVHTAQNRFAAGDPYLARAGFPYLFTTTGSRPHQILIQPSYQTLLMDPSLTSRKAVVMNSQLIDLTHAWRIRSRLETVLKVEFRRDDATTKQSVGPLNADADKLSLHLGLNHFWLDQRHRLSLAGGVIRNRARGRPLSYDRQDLEVVYAGPAWGRQTLKLSLAGYQLNFPASDPRRLDLHAAAAASLRVPLGGPWALEFNASFARNASRLKTFDYDRAVVMTALTLASFY